MRVVIDTNVLVSGFIRTHTPPARIVDLMRTGSLNAVIDDRILDEYEDVLRRESFRPYFTEGDAESILEFLRHESHGVVCDAVVGDLPDQGDIPFLEAALSAGVPLITGNKRHFPAQRRRGADVLSPREFLARYFEDP